MNDDHILNDQEEIVSQEQELEDVKNQALDFQRGWQRAVADYDNLKKEMSRKIEESGQFHEANLFRELLPIYEHLPIALEHVPESSKSDAWFLGLEQVKKLFEDFFQKHQVKKIKTIGQQFDPQIHQAVELRSSQKPDHEIIQELKAGWQMDQAVLLPALVVVSSGQTDEISQENPPPESTVKDN